MGRCHYCETNRKHPNGFECTKEIEVKDTDEDSRTYWNLLMALPHKKEVRKVAWKMHLANGHQKGYDGPCWGPTLKELEEAEALVRKEREIATDIHRALHGNF